MITAPNLTADCIPALVACFRNDSSQVLAARTFVFDALACGNKSGANTYARALSVYFWKTGQRDFSERFARISI